MAVDDDTMYAILPTSPPSDHVGNVHARMRDEIANLDGCRNSYHPTENLILSQPRQHYRTSVAPT